MKLSQAYADIPSPCYVLEEAELQKNLQVFSDLQAATGCKVLLALKAYALWPSFPLLRPHLAGCTASSLHELRLGKELFCAASDKQAHIYSPAYQQHEFAAICQYADHIVFNSLAQWQQFRQTALQAKRSCGLRINPQLREVETDLYNPCASGSRLGIMASALNADVMQGIEGLHAHALCENMQHASIRLIDAIEEQCADFLAQLKWINFGGGHLITHQDYDVDALQQRLKDFKQRWHLDVYLEPGSAIVWQTGFLLTSVVDLVHNEGIDIAILDCSATAHMPDVLEMPYRPEVRHAGKAGDKAHPYQLTGNSCLAGDVIGDYSFDQPLSIGSQLIFEDMMHYTTVKSSMFNGVQHPDMGLLSSEGHFHHWRHFDYEDYKNRMG